MEYSEACSDVWYLLESLKPNELNKIPKKMIETIRILKNDDYISKIDLNIPLEEQKLSKPTIGLISFIYNNYLGTEQEKEEYERTYKEYIDNIKKTENNSFDLKSKTTKNERQENNKILIQQEKNGLFIRLLNKIKKMFIKE